LLAIIAVPVGLLIGLSLGALGGGGSILTVPALVYLLHQPPHAATTGSLLIVAITALAGMAAHWRAGRVQVAQGITFGVLGVAGSYAGTRMSASISPSLLLTLFAVLMLAAATAMLHQRRPASAPAAAVPAPDSPPAADAPQRMTLPLAADRAPAMTLDRPAPVAPGRQAGTPAGKARGRASLARRAARIAAAATGAGLLTGFFGVGGGFVIVPALVLALGYEMPAAVGTSLLVISVNSTAALAARLGDGVRLDWPLLAVFILAALAGALAGNRVASRVSVSGLTATFTVLLAAVAVYMLARSLLALL
jgi:uncharacterized protein